MEEQFRTHFVYERSKHQFLKQFVSFYVEIIYFKNVVLFSILTKAFTQPSNILRWSFLLKYFWLWAINYRRKKTPS